MNELSNRINQLSIPAHLVGLGVDGVLLYVGIRKGGWWHILTAVGAIGALTNVGFIMTKMSQPEAAK
jgi:hypothetical protein